MQGLSTIKLMVVRALPLVLISLVAMLVTGVSFSGAEDLRILNDPVDGQVAVKKGDDIRYELIAGEVLAQASPADPHGTMMITL